MEVLLEKPKPFNPKFVVVACFLEAGGKLLLLHRNDDRPEGNTWGVSAGKVEKGEQLQQALIRELTEEIGYAPQPDQLTYFKEVFIRYPDFEFAYHIYRTILDKEPAIELNLAEHKNFKWVTPKEAVKMNLIPGEEECIRLIYKF